MNLNRKFTEAGITAKPFLGANEYIEICFRLVKRRGQMLKNFKMEKSL